MQIKIRLKALVFLILTLIITRTAFAGPNDVVIVAIDYDLTTVNTLESKTGNDLLLFHIHENLMGSDPVTGDLEPVLAESLTVMPNGKDIKVKLEKDHLFHTGDPVTAHDVKWTFEQSTLPENSHFIASTIEEIEEIEIIDDYNLIFRHYDSYAPWRENMWIGICSKNYFEKVGREKFRTHPVGSGSFRFVSRTIGDNLVMESYDGYTYKEHVYNKNKTKILERKVLKKKVDYKTLKLVAVRDPITRMAMLEAGEADMIYGILPHDIKRLSVNKNIRIKKTSNVPSFFALATKPLLYPIMADFKFQMAITHAINRQEIIDKVFLGEGYPMYMYASKSELGYDPTVKFDFNPDRARKLVKESSYKPGDPIILTFTSMVPNSNLIAAIIQKYLRDVGITVQLQQLEAGVQATYSRNRDRREGHMTLYSWSGGRDPQVRLMLTVMSDSIYTSYPGRPSAEILDQLVLQQSKEMDKEKRLAVLKKIHKILTKEPSSVPLYGLNQIYAMNNRINYTWTPKAGFPYNLHRIKIVK